jgi:hypothetical protein
MHTAAYRANALLTYAGTALAILAALASLTGPTEAGCVAFSPQPWAGSDAQLGLCADLWHQASPSAHVKLVKTERLHALENHLGRRDDEASRVDAMLVAWLTCNI